MSDDNGNGHDDGDFGEGIPEPLDFLDKPDINDYLDLGTDDGHLWEDAWTIAPVQDMTEGQIEAFIDVIYSALDADWEWQDIYDAMYDDFWEFFGEFYTD